MEWDALDVRGGETERGRGRESGDGIGGAGGSEVEGDGGGREGLSEIGRVGPERE
jgi:hypothetical protein